MSQPLVHVLIINWNGMEHLQACYESLLRESYENVRFVLVDNGSSDESVTYVRDTFGHDPRVEILDLGENLGWSGGNNRGITRALEANADYVFLLNNDTAVQEECIAALVNAAQADPATGCLAPKMVLFDNPQLLNSVGLACSVIGGCWDIGLGRLDGPKWNQVNDVIGACGGAAFFRAEAIGKAGLLPEEFGIYLDDLDLCLRVWNAGYAIRSCPAAVVRHKFSATMGTGERYRQKYLLNVRNRAYLLSRNAPASDLLSLTPAYLAGECRSIARGVLDGEPWKAATHLRAAWEALRYLPTGRDEFRRHGQQQPAFRHLLKKDPLFYPGTEFPTHGWYAERLQNGSKVRPISRTAEIDAPGGALRVSLHNCYPRYGVAEVQVRQHTGVVATLATANVVTQTLQTEPGPLVFEANTIFDADDTGEKADFGGWLSLDGLTPA